MRILVIILFGFLVACNGTTTEIPSSVPNESTQVAALQAQVKSLQQQMGSLALIGKSNHSANSFSAESLNGVSASSFGPCADMGVLIGFTNQNGNPADALSAISQDFRQCTGYMYSVIISSGAINTAPRLFWDGPNCTGNPIEWEAAGTGYNTESLQNGVVFSSPTDGSILMVKAGQTPQQIMIQSVWVTSNPGCQSDVETQLMYTAEPNDSSVSGVPSNGVGSFQLGSP